MAIEKSDNRVFTDAYCISLKQPFAELIVNGKKTIELRRWRTKYRGKIYIHASKKPYLPALARFSIDQKDIVTGAIIGKAVLVGCNEYKSDADFLRDEDKHLCPDPSFGPFGFVLEGAARLDKPVPAKGKLGIFKLEPQVVKLLGN